MKKLEYFYEGLYPLDNLTNLAPKDDLLFFDIETTGLSRQKNHIYLIGIGYYSSTGLNVIQWFAENSNEENLILKSFIDFSSSFLFLVNYNGKSFDIPFTTERMSKYGLSMPELESVDIYTLVKPLKKILSLNDLTQKSIEHFLGITREDKYNGGELIPVYKHYTESKKDADLKLLLLHNKEDVLNMHYLTEILNYNGLCDVSVTWTDSKLHDYQDYNGTQKKELILYGLHDFYNLPNSLNTFKNEACGSFIMNLLPDGTFQIRIPLLELKLNYYISNYKDYYYLPREDICILKSMASGVQKEDRVNATKDTCKVSYSGVFIPLPATFKNNDLHGIRIFKDECKSKNCFIRLENFDSFDIEIKSYILNIFYKFFI